MNFLNLLKKQDGFTFIEVIIAVTILFLAVMTVSLLLLQGYQIMASAGKRSESLHLTQEEMEAAIADADYAGSDYEEVEIDRAMGQEVWVFGEKVTGTLVTVKRIYSGPQGGEITYTYFVPDSGGAE